MANIGYRGAKSVPVTELGTLSAGPHEGEVKLRTQVRVGQRPAGSIDYRKPENVHSGQGTYRPGK